MAVNVLLFIAAVVTLGASQEPEECPLDVQIAFTQMLPNARVCAPSIGRVLTPVNVTVTDALRSAMINDLDNVCIESCGGNFADFLSSKSCNDSFGALTLEVFCTATNGDATIGPYCRFASGDFDQTIFSVLMVCYNSTICVPGCRDALIELKSRIGCCYQNLYNNTEYLMELANAQFLPLFAFDELQLLNDPLGNPWDACNVRAPQECIAEPFGCSTCRMNSTCEEECATASIATPSSSAAWIPLYSSMISMLSLLAVTVASFLDL